MSETQTTLRDTLTSVVEQAEKAAETPAPQEEVAKVAPEETAEQKAERLRDEKGRFAKTDEIKTDEIKTERKRPPRPSSWKKEFWDHWETLDIPIAEYISQREQEAARGVSAYKSEADKAKQVWDTVAPYQDYINTRGGDAIQVIKSLLHTASAFNSSDPQTRLAALVQAAQQFQIPLDKALLRGEDGQLYLNPQFQPEPKQTQTDIRQTVKELLAEEALQRQVASFAADKEKYPHFENVRVTMAGLLQAGLADDMASAYETALRMPKHSDIFESINAQKKEQEEAKKREQAQKLVESAKSKAVSTKTSTPVGTAKASDKGLRSILEEAFEEHVSARV